MILILILVTSYEVSFIKKFQNIKEFYGINLINKINIDDLQEYITAGCYYLDDITLLDEDSYFEKIKTYINNVDENKIISNIITVGINETFETGVEFNNNTKFYSKGNDINSIKNLENVKGNINSIRLEKNTINKKNFPIVKTFER